MVIFLFFCNKPLLFKTGVPVVPADKIKISKSYLSYSPLISIDLTWDVSLSKVIFVIFDLG